MKHIIMAFGALAIAGAVPVLAQSTPPTPAPDATMAPPAAPTPPAPDGSMTPAQPGSTSPGSTSPGSTPPSSAMPGDPPGGGTTSGSSMSNGGTSPGTMPSSGMQSNMPAATTGPLPKCTAKIKDRCDQSTTSERYALSADQAMKTGGVGDRRSDNAGAMGKSTAKKHMMHHRTMHKPAAAAAPAPAA